MKRVGYACRIVEAGDPEISGALTGGIRAATPPEDPRRAEIAQRSRESVRRAAMWQHSPEEWAQMTLDARLKYARRAPWLHWGEKLLGGYGLVCYLVAGAFRRLNEAVFPEGRE